MNNNILLCRLSLLLILLSITGGCASISKDQLDAEVTRLCALDGGARIYEAVRLPASSFNSYGQINFYHPTKKKAALGDEYIFKNKTEQIRSGTTIQIPSDAEILRFQFQVIRKGDGKLLGESVLYSRRGGDVPALAHPSTFTCPGFDQADDIVLLKKVFIRAN